MVRTIIRFSFLIAALCLSAGFAVAAEPETFSVFPADDDVDCIDLMEDQTYLVLAHKEASRVTVWDITTNKEVAAFDTPNPAFVLCRGTRIYVANYGHGLVSVYDAAKNCEKVAEVKTGTGLENVAILAAPGGKAFKGQLLGLCDISKKERQMIFVDTNKQKASALGKGDIAGIAVDFDGKNYFWQLHGGSPDRNIPGFKSWPLLCAGRDSPLGAPMPDTLPIFRQVQPGTYWFGGNRIGKGMPPGFAGDARGQFVIGDRSKQLGYALLTDDTGHYLEAFELKGTLNTVGKRLIQFPKEYKRFAPRFYADPGVTHMHDFKNIGVTGADGKLRVYVYEAFDKLVWTLTTEAFPGDDVRTQKEPPAIASNVPVTPAVNDNPMKPTKPNVPRPMPATPAPTTPAEVPAPLPPEFAGIHPLDGGPFSLSYGLGGKSILLADGTTFRVLDPSGKKVLSTHEWKQAYLRVEERSQYYVALAADCIDLLKKDDFKVIRSIPLNADPECMALHPTKPVTYVAFKPARADGGNPPQALAEIDETVGSVSKLEDVKGNMVQCDPTGKRLFVGAHMIYDDGLEFVERRGIVKKYGDLDVVTAYDITGDKPRETAVNKSPATNGRRLAIAPDGGHVAYVAAVGPKEARNRALCSLSTLGIDREGVRCVLEGGGIQACYHPMADLLAGCTSAGVWIYQRSTGKTLTNKMEPRNLKDVREILFSADGKNLLVGYQHPELGWAVEAIALDLSTEEQAALAHGFPGGDKVKGPAIPAPMPANPAAAESRTWKDATGTFSIEAKLVAIVGDNVKLIRTDGKEIQVPIKQLSEGDQTYLNGLKGSPKEPAKSPFEP